MAELSVVYIEQITKKLNNIKKRLNEIAETGENPTQEVINAKVKLIEDFLEKQLLEIRQEIIEFANKHYCSILKQLTFIEPIVNANLTNLDSVLEWARAVANWFSGGYTKILLAQAELLYAVTTLSLAVIEMASFTANNTYIPPITISIPPIEVSEIMSCPT